MDIRVSFCYYIYSKVTAVGNLPCLKEILIENDFEVYRSDLLNNRELSILLTITSEDSRTQISDALPPLALNLCFKALPNLLESTPVVYRYFTSGAQVNLRSDGSFVQIFGEQGTFEGSCHDLVLQLFNCGKRMLALYRRLYGNNPLHLAGIKHIEKQAYETEKYLMGYGLLDN